MRSLKQVVVASHGGSVTVSSLSGSSLTGGTGVRLVGGSCAQITGAKATVAGGKVYVGAGSGFGMVADSRCVQIGKVASPEDLTGAGGVQKPHVAVGEWGGETGAVRAQAADGELKLKDGAGSFRFGNRSVTCSDTVLHLDSDKYELKPVG
jgi:hypothetical protein